MSDSGRKISSDYDNIVDNTLIDASESVSPTFKSIGYTPNGITTLSTIFGVASLYYINNRNIYPFLLCFFLFYFFDVLDGYYARKYDMKSEFGAQYDFWKDFVVYFFLSLIIYNKYDPMDYPVLMCILLFFTFTSFLFFSCQEKITKKENRSSTLKVYNNMFSKKTCNDYSDIIGYFGPGITIVVLMIIIWYIHECHMEKIMRINEE